MQLGGNIFLIMNFVIKAIRLFFEIFGDDDDRGKVHESKKRSSNGNGDAC